MAARRKEELLRTTGIEKLRQSVVVQSQLKQIDNGVEAKAAFGGMDLAFVNPSGGLMGLSLFGDREVVGLVVEPDQKGLELRLRRMGKKDDMDDLLAQGARVVGLTSADLAKWLLYYGEAAGYLPILGARTWEQSGLRKYKREEVNQISAAVKQLVSVPENNAYLHAVGAVKLASVGGDERGVYIFEDQGNREVSVVLRNVRTPEMEGHLLREVVNTHETMGVVLPRHGEDKIELYVRAYQLGQKYSATLGREVVFAAATAGQIKLWEGWGMAPEMMSQNLVSESEILDLLIFGESNLLPGFLARADSIGDGQWALLDRKLMPGVITFVGRMSRDGRDIRQLPPVQVFDHRAREKGEFKTIPLNGAVAIMRVPEDMPFEEMKRIAKPIEDRFAHLMNSVGRRDKPKLIFLTPSLMEYWRTGGFWATAEQVRWFDQARRREYGFGETIRGGGDDEGDYYSSVYSGQAIGGGFRTLLRRKKDKDALVLLDTSTQFDNKSRPEYRRYADALVTGVLEEDIPMWPNLLEPEGALHATKIIDQKVTKAGADKDPGVVYFATLVAAGVTEAEIKEILGDKVGLIVWEIGNANQGLFGDPNASMVYPMSHIHIDHAKLTQTLKANIPVLMSLANRIMAEARDDLNPVSAEVLTAPEWWNAKRGKATPRKDREIVVLKDGEEFTRDGFRIELGSVEHSTIGAVARRIEFPDGLVVADTGDFRRWGRSVADGSKTERTIKKWADEKLDWLIVEATAIRKGADLDTRNWRKRLENTPPITDEPLFEGVREVLTDPKNAGKTIVVFSSPYDLGRNVTLMEAAKSAGRESVLGLRHAMIASRYTTEQELLGANARAYEDMDLKVPPYGLYLTEGSKTYTATTALSTELMTRGVSVYDRNGVLRDGQAGKVLFFNPFGNEIASLDNLPLEEKLEVIWSSSIMYSQADLGKFVNNKAHYFMKYVDGVWAEPNFWKGSLPFKMKHPKSGILHRSGHSVPLEIGWFLSHFEYLDGLNILLHHLEKGTQAVEFIHGLFPKAKWNIVSSLPHYDSKVMPTKEKRWVGPLLRLDK